MAPRLVHVANLRGGRGPQGPAGTFAHVSAETIPAGQPAEAIASGPQTERSILFRIPQGMTPSEAASDDAAVAGYLGSPGSLSSIALERAVGTGFNVLIVSGQSLAGGTQATPDPSLDYDFEGLLWWGCTPGEAGFHQLNEFTELPLPGGLVEKRPYGVMGALTTARMWYEETGIPVVIIPVFAGGAGFYSHNTVAGRWLVGESTYAPLAQLSVTETNLALDAIRLLGPIRDAALIWNQGEADRDIAVTQAAYAEALDDLINLWRTSLTLDHADQLPIIVARQLPERRATDGPLKAGVDRAQLDTPRRIEFSAVMHPPRGFVASDGTHALAPGQREMGRRYYAALKRARLNRKSISAAPVTGLRMTPNGLEWEAPESGRTEGFLMQVSVGGGAWADGAAPQFAGALSHSPDFSSAEGDVRFRVTTLAAAGNSAPAEVEAVLGGQNTGLVFDFAATSLSAKANGDPVASGDWASINGSATGLAFTGVSTPTPLVYHDDPVLPGSSFVRFDGGALATPAGSLALVDATYVALVRVRQASSNVQNIFSGPSGGGHRLFTNGPANRIAAGVGTSGGVNALLALGEWTAVAVVKEGTHMWMRAETADGNRSIVDAEVGAATQTLFALSNTNRAYMDVCRVLCFDRPLNGYEVTRQIGRVLASAGLR